MGLLADAFSYGDSLKRKVGGLLADPMGTIELGINRIKEDNNNALNLAANAYPMAGNRTVLNTPAQKAGFKKQLADYASENGLSGVIAYRAGGKYGMTADKGGPTFFSTTEEGAKPFARNGEVRAVDIQPQNVLDASRGEGIGLYDQFLKETNSYAGRGSTYRPFWTAEHDLSKWLKAKGKNYDAIMFDEPTGVPSYAVYAKDAIK